MSLGYQNRLEGDMIVEGLRCAELEPVFSKDLHISICFQACLQSYPPLNSIFETALLLENFPSQLPFFTTVLNVCTSVVVVYLIDST